MTINYIYHANAMSYIYNNETYQKFEIKCTTWNSFDSYDLELSFNKMLRNNS